MSFRPWTKIIGRHEQVYSYAHFTTISAHFIAVQIYLFPKTKVLTIILKFLTRLNLKSYDIKHFSIFFSFVKILFENLRLINGNFKTIFGHFFAKYKYVFHKTEDMKAISMCLACLNLNWVKSYDILLVKILLFSCLKMHHFRGILRE